MAFCPSTWRKRCSTGVWTGITGFERSGLPPRLPRIERRVRWRKRVPGVLQLGTLGVNLFGRNFNQFDAAVSRPALISLVARHRRIGSGAESNQPASGNSVFGDEGADDRLRARLGELHSKDKNDLKAGFYDTGQFVQLTGGFSF